MLATLQEIGVAQGRFYGTAERAYYFGRLLIFGADWYDSGLATR